MRICVYCSKELPWIFSGKKLKDGSKIYTDEKGSRWAGKRCPSCEKKRVQAAVKYDQFEKNNIIKSIENSGFNVISTSSPLIAEKDGERKSISVRRAYTREDGSIIIEAAPSNEDASDMTALLFQTVKLCDRAQMERLENRIEVFQKKDGRTERINPEKEGLSV